MNTRKGVRHLSSLLDVQNGYAFDSKKFGQAGLPLIRIRDLRNAYRTEISYAGEYDERYLVRSGDFLIGMDGEFACYEWKGENALLNQRVCKLYRFSKELNPRFLFLGINSYLKSIEDSTAYTTVKHISSRQILEIAMPIPTLKEQDRIVAILDEALEKIAAIKINVERNLENTRSLFATALQKHLGSGKASWRDLALGEAAEVQSGGTPLISRKDYWGGEIPWYSSGELNDFYTVPPKRYITQSGLLHSNAKLFPRGSLLIGMYDTAALKMSIADRDAAFNQAIAGVKPNAGLDLQFLFHTINANKATILSQRRGTRQRNLSLTKIKAIRIKVPPISVQIETVKLLQEDAVSTAKLSQVYEQKLAALEELKRSLLHEAFSGEL